MPNTNSQKPVPHTDMIHWYQPLLLLRTGARALLATVIGQIADNRELQGLGCPEATNRWNYASRSSEASESAEPADFWLDFVADMGDGWLPSHSVASLVASESVTVDGTRLPRAELLLLGGDLVYPDPSLEAYQERTLAPYQAACAPQDAFSADVFAVPGNHDWYDGLHAFQDIFCHDDPDAPQWPFGHWHKPQSHSYFALRLPGHWWLLAPDVQLDNRINPAQRRYFKRVVADMTVDDRVIIVAPYPNWSQFDPHKNGQVVRELQGQCEEAGARVALVLTGDLHHYSRYSRHSSSVEHAAPDSSIDYAQRHLITAGGGGAFLHPTHTLNAAVDLREDNSDGGALQTYAKECSYPSASRSHRLSLQNLLFPVTNWELSLFVGFVYTMLAWVLETRMLVGAQQVSALFEDVLRSYEGVGATLTHVVTMIPKSPEFAAVVLLTALGLTAFNENCGGRTRIFLGALHTVFHLIGLILTFCIAIALTGWVYNQLGTLSFSFFWFLLTMVVLGGGVGGVVIGVYLTLSLNLFGANLTNAFSSLRLASHKNFLRIKIAPDGTLTVYPIGIDDPQGRNSEAHLIEAPIVIRSGKR